MSFLADLNHQNYKGNFPSKLMKILITGSEGVIGKILQKNWKEHKLVLLDIKKSRNSIQADICDISTIERYFKGVDVVIHLAGKKKNSLEWNELFEVNVHGTRNVFEAAAKANVKRVIFASTLHVHRIMNLFKFNKKITDKTIVCSSNDYGLSKILGERIGEDYHSQYKIDVINLRLGSITKNNEPSRDETGKFRQIGLAHWLSHKDFIKVINASLKIKGFISIPCTSANNKSVVDIKCMKKILGVTPTDSSYKYVA